MFGVIHLLHEMKIKEWIEFLFYGNDLSTEIITKHTIFYFILLIQM